MRTLGKTQAVDESPAACDALAKFCISDGDCLIAESRFICVLLCEPVHKLSHCGEIRDAFELLLGEHVVEVLFVCHHFIG